MTTVQGLSLIEEWPSPFWCGSLDEWHHLPLMEWRHPHSDHAIYFQATCVEPASHCRVRSSNKLMPIVFFFGGMSNPSGLEGLGIERGEMKAFAAELTSPCIVVTPLRPKGTFWILNSGGDFGFIEGDLKIDMVECFAEWMQALCKIAIKEGNVDGERPRAFGFSAGAYALTEILAHGDPFLWSIALGGLHGHGQPDLDGIKGKWLRWGDSVIDKFNAYIKRLRRHPGVPGGIFWLHHPDDTVCLWKYARIIADVLDERQRGLGHAALKVEEIWNTDRLSSSALKLKKKLKENWQRNEDFHNYQDQAFFRSSFLDDFLFTPARSCGLQKRAHVVRTRSTSPQTSNLRLSARRRRSRSRSQSINYKRRQREHGRSCSDDSRARSWESKKRVVLIARR